MTPAAMAYTAYERTPGSPAPHPGEGTRLGPVPEEEEPAPDPIPFRPLGRAQQPAAIAQDDDGPVIGATVGGGPPMVKRTLPSTVGTPASPRRYQPPAGEHMPRKPMPKIYDRHPIFGYWYVPAAVLLAIFVAFAVIWVGGKLTGGDDADKASTNTPAPTNAPGGGGTTPPPQTSTAAATQSPQPGATPSVTTGPGKFKAGDTLVVTGTGDCLNVRTKAGRENDAIVCVKDGTELVVTGGPETAGDLTWWKVRTELGEGWAAEDYLAKKP